MKRDHREFASEWVQAWNSHDLDRILTHYEDDVTLISPRVRLVLGANDGMVRGKAALRRYFELGLEKLPNLTFYLERVFSSLDSIVIEFRTSDGRHGAEFMVFTPDGRVARIVAHYASE